MEHSLLDNIRDVIISVLLSLSLRLIFLGKLIIVRMTILYLNFNSSTIWLFI